MPVDPMQPAGRKLAMTAVNYIMYQLTGLAEGQYTLHRLIDVVKERFDTTWDELTGEDIDAIDHWLSSRVCASQGEVRLRWGFIRGLLETLHEERNATGIGGLDRNSGHRFRAEGKDRSEDDRR